MQKNRMRLPLEIKATSGREFEGYGSVFGNVDLGGDIVVPGAYAKSLAEQKDAGRLPQMFWMHNPSLVPGKWVDMDEDELGLKVKGVFAKTQLGDELYELTKMGAVRGLSIGYRVADSGYDKHGNRLLKEIELWETSLVSMPMNPDAEIAHVKSRVSFGGEYVPTERELERALRDVGFAQSWAKKFVAQHCADLRDVSGEPEDQDEAEAKALLASLDRLTDGTWAGVFKR